MTACLDHLIINQVYVLIVKQKFYHKMDFAQIIVQNNLKIH